MVLMVYGSALSYRAFVEQAAGHQAPPEPQFSPVQERSAHFQGAVHLAAFIDDEGVGGMKGCVGRKGQVADAPAVVQGDGGAGEPGVGDDDAGGAVGCRPQ